MRATLNRCDFAFSAALLAVGVSVSDAGAATEEEPAWLGLGASAGLITGAVLGCRRVMQKEMLTASEAARALGSQPRHPAPLGSRRRITTQRDDANRRLVSVREVERLKGAESRDVSARNRFHGVVRDVKTDGLLAQVELDVTEPTRILAIITREAAEELGLRKGMAATALVKATSVMVKGIEHA